MSLIIICLIFLLVVTELLVAGESSGNQYDQVKFRSIDQNVIYGPFARVVEVLPAVGGMFCCYN